MSHRFRFVSAYLLAAVFIYVIRSGYCKKRAYYLSLERPRIPYSDPEYLANMRFTARRMSRSDPVHYMNLSFILKKSVTNEITHSFYFYQLLTNVYKRSFVEFHYTTCDLMQTENMFGISTLTGYYNVPAAERPYPMFQCPVKPGYYRFEGIKIVTKYIPENFPFNEGRVYYNSTIGNRQLVGGQIDFQLLIDKTK